jgi:hypothetical protein
MFIKFGRLRWAENVMRVEKIYSTKEVHCTKVIENGDRRRGRPKLGWCDELQ